MKKSLIAAVALVAVVTLGGCVTNMGLTTLKDDKVAAARTLWIFTIPIPLKPKVYDCSSGTVCPSVN